MFPTVASTLVGLVAMALPSAGLECYWFGLQEVRKGDVIEFKSPGYPANYPNLYKCGVQFYPASGDVSVQLICSDVALHRDTGAWAALKKLFLSYDWVFLASGPWIQDFPSDHTSLPRSWRAEPGKKITFAFSTNIVDTSRGFLCTVIGQDNVDATRTCGQRNNARSGRRLHVPRNLTQLGAWARGGRQILPDDNKIFGGEDAGPNEWPWMAHVVVAMSGGNVGICSGTIISANYVLSAAHCFTDVLTGTTATLRVGASSLTSPSVQAIAAASIQLHPDFTVTGSGAFLNDLALLRLPTPLVLTDEVAPVCLPSFSDRARLYTPGTAEITGWGTTSNSAPVTANLQEATATMLNLNTCKTLTSNEATFRQLCTNPVTGMSTCPGDSGGPLKIADYDGRYTQIGITSYGTSSCEQDSPFVVYTRVDQYLEWIRDNSDVTILP